MLSCLGKNSLCFANHWQNTMSLSQDVQYCFVKLTDLLEGQSIIAKEKPTVIPYYVFLSCVSPLVLTHRRTLHF